MQAATSISEYLDAATRENTTRSYRSALRHFEEEWGGFLPATSAAVAQYLADYGGRLSANTLRHRLAAIGQWHVEQGFADPTKAQIVKQVMKGIQTLHPAIEKQAVPLQIAQLEHVSAHLEALVGSGFVEPNTLRSARDRALLLVGFWRGFRGDEIKRLRIENITEVPGKGLRCFIARSKGDRQAAGRTFIIPSLDRLCPVKAYRQWISLSGLTNGPVFRSVSRWGSIGSDELHANSFIPLLRRMFADAKLPMPEEFSSHSLRRGFAVWANENGWQLKQLMEYVGWKDIRSALRYIESANPFEGTAVKDCSRQGIDTALPGTEASQC